MVEGKDEIIFVVIRDDEGYESLRSYLVEDTEVAMYIAMLLQQLKPGEVVARYYNLPQDNYFVKHLMMLIELSPHAGGVASVHLEELISAMIPAIRGLNIR